MNKFKQRCRHWFKLIFSFVGATILFLWGWNNSIPELFGLPLMKFKQATGLMILMGIISFLLKEVHREREQNARPYHYDSIIEKES